MKITTYTNKGLKGKEIELPKQFYEEVRHDLIKRAYLTIRANNRQVYGTKEGAGMNYSAKLSRRRRDYKTGYGRGMSRIPRKTMMRRGTQFIYVGAVVSGTVGGRRAHPPKSQRSFIQKINIKENRKAIRSAISASINKELVESRGHKFSNVPVVIDNLEVITKTKELKQLLIKLGLEKELDRTSVKKIRPGRGKSRGRKYKNAKGPLIVVEKNSPIFKTSKNLLGFDTVKVNSLNLELLAPGSYPGRLIIWSTSAIEKLSKDNLYYNKKNGSV